MRLTCIFCPPARCRRPFLPRGSVGWSGTVPFVHVYLKYLCFYRLYQKAARFLRGSSDVSRVYASWPHSLAVLQSEIWHLCCELRGDVANLVDAFDIPAHLLRAPAASGNGPA